MLFVYFLKRRQSSHLDAVDFKRAREDWNQETYIRPIGNPNDITRLQSLIATFLVKIRRFHAVNTRISAQALISNLSYGRGDYSRGDALRGRATYQVPREVCKVGQMRAREKPLVTAVHTR